MTELEALINAYVELNRMHTTPGEKAHILASSIHFLEKQIRKILDKYE